MISHKRVWLSALAFSASIGVLLAVPAFLGFMWTASISDPSDDGAVRGVGMLAYFAIQIALYSICLTLPLSYAAAACRLQKFRWVAIVCLVLVACMGGFWGLKGIPPDLWLFLTGLPGAVLLASAYVWWRVLTRQVTA